MKRLFGKIFILLLAVLCFLLVVDYLSINSRTKEVVARLTNSTDYIDQGSGTEEITPIIQYVRQNEHSHVLIIGDSIARQMFTILKDENPDVTVACANAAINITGQYMLAMEYLSTHEGATDVYMIVHPLTMTRTFDLDLGYGYAVMPFAIEGSIKYLDDETVDQMASVYGRLSLNASVADLIDSSPLNRKMFMSYIRMHNTEYVQSNAYEISAHYIMKLMDECEKRGAIFHIYPSPSTEYFRDRIEETREDYMNSPLGELYPDYLDEVYYFPTEWSDDLTHFGEEYANLSTYVEVIKKAYDDPYLNSIMER